MLRGKIRVGGVFFMRKLRKDGGIDWEIKTPNLITLEGRNHILDVLVHGGTQIGTWYFAPFSSDSSPASGWTYATPVATEFTDYNEATRQAWVETAPSAGSVTTSSRAILNITGTATIYGAMLVGGGSSPTTKGNTAGGGTLLAAGRFSTSKIVSLGDIIEIGYTLSASDDGV